MGFTGGYGISDSWKGDGRTEDHWRDTNARIEGPAVKFLQAAFAESWLETTATAIGGEGYFPRLEPVGKVPAQIVSSSPAGGSFKNYMLFLLSINSARKSILITNPYFIQEGDDGSLVKAAARGVSVVVLVPGETTAISRTLRAAATTALCCRRRPRYSIIRRPFARQDDGRRRHLGNIGSTNFDNRLFP